MSSYTPSQWAAKMHERAKRMDVELEKATKACAKNIERDVKMLTPVKKGKLRKGWKANKTGKFRWKVENDVKYGPPVEFGHRMTKKQKQMAAIILSKEGKVSGGSGVWFVPGRRMLGMAVHRNEPVLRRKVNEAIRNAII